MKDNDNFEPWDGDAVVKWFERLDAQLEEIFAQPLPEFDELKPFDVDAIAGVDVGPLDVGIADIADIEPPEFEPAPFDVDAIADIGPLDAELFGDTDAPTGPETPRTGEGDGGRV